MPSARPRHPTGRQAVHRYETLVDPQEEQLVDGAVLGVLVEHVGVAVDGLLDDLSVPDPLSMAASCSSILLREERTLEDSSSSC